jgi:DNA polymerase-4
VAANKLVAKIANNVGKASARGDGPPNAITVVPPGREAEFLAPLPAGELWGVGPKTADKLAGLGIRTIGDVAAWPAGDLAHRFGKNGEEMARHARGLDDRPVVTQRERKSVSQEITFTRDVGDGAALRRTLREQAFEVARILQRKELTGATVKLKLRRADFTTLTRQSTFDRPTDEGQQIFAAAVQLFDRVWDGQPVRLIGVGVGSLSSGLRQMSLWEQPDERRDRLDAALDELRARFGAGVVRRASELEE